MIRNRTLVLLGVVVYLIWMVVLFPLSTYQQQLKQSLSGVADLQSMKGSLWSADLQYSAHKLPNSIQQGALDWRISPLPLFWLQLGGNVSVSHPGLRITGLVSTGVDSIKLNSAEGQFEARFVNQLLERQGVQLSGELTVKDLSLHVEKAARVFNKAEGELHYPGGRATINQGRLRKNLTLPPLVGVLSDEEGGLKLEVMLQGKDQVLATVKLKQDGWGELSVSKGFFEAIGQSDLISDINIKEQIF